MNKRLLTLLAAALLAGCTTNLKPMQPVRRIETWEPNDTATQPATQSAATEPIIDPKLADTQPFVPPGAATQSAATQTASTQAATQPSHVGEHLVAVKIIDPNQTSRFVYKASYDNIWQQGLTLLTHTGCTFDRKDYRLGLLTTDALPSSQFLEFWKPQQTNFTNAMENTINNQRRTIRLTISRVPEKPDFYEIAFQVLVERQSNPLEDIGGPVFVEGSGFGRSQVSLRSDYVPAVLTGVGPNWYVVGHDPNLEHKLLQDLFKHI